MNYLQNLPAKAQIYALDRVQNPSKSKRLALLDAGYAPSTARCPAIVETKAFKFAFANLIRHRIPAHIIAKRLAEGLDATETRFLVVDKAIVEKQVVDFAERRAYLEIAAKYGEYVAPAAEATPSAVNVNVTLVGSPVESV